MISHSTHEATSGGMAITAASDQGHSSRSVPSEMTSSRPLAELSQGNEVHELANEGSAYGHGASYHDGEIYR